MKAYLNNLAMYVCHAFVVGATIYFAEWALEAWTR